METTWKDIGIRRAPWPEPTAVQQAVVPPMLAGKDLVAVAPTGTGKTAAYGLPLVQDGALALVVAPTRELAEQIGRRLAALGGDVTVVTGGVPRPVQIEALARDPRIVVGTPGRLTDLARRGPLGLARFDHLVVDEADQLLDAGFQDDLQALADGIGVRRTVLTSATWPPSVERLAALLTDHPVLIRRDERPGTVAEHVFYVNGNDQRTLLAHLLDDPAVERALVFVRTRQHADTLARLLPHAHLLHGGRSASERTTALDAFRSAGGVLIATDVAARGLDLPQVTHVVNHGMPHEPATYVHRIGRTGRAGRSGVAWSLCTAEDGGRLRDVERFTGRPLAPVLDHPWNDLSAIPDPRATARSSRTRRGKRRRR
jgi:ATP-dependent RNA helicase RhlE